MLCTVDYNLPCEYTKWILSQINQCNTCSFYRERREAAVLERFILDYVLSL